MKKTRIKFTAICSLLIVLCCLLTACASFPRADYAGLGRPADLVPLTKKALIGTLPNGLKYYILENSMPQDRAYIGLVINAGSVLERDDQRGFAHFIEHLAFNDTARFPNLQLVEYLRSLGMRFGADFNAYTSYNETVYHLEVPVENIDGIKRIPEQALAILDDWSYRVNFTGEGVDNEKRVVLEEIRARTDAMQRVRKITSPLIFAGSPYADHEIIGLASIIEEATPEQLQEFYDRWYTSDNMAIVFIGDFDGKVLEAELANHFNIPAAAKPVNRPVYDLPPPVNGSFTVEIITDPELTSTSYSIYFKQKDKAQNGTLKSYRDSIIDYLISVMLNQRFDEASQNPESAAIESWAGQWHWVNTRFYTMGLESKTGRSDESLQELLLEKESIRRFGFTEGELARAKLNLVSYMQRQLSEKDRRQSRSFLRDFTSHFLHGENITDIEWEEQAVNALLPGIGLREITRVVNNYFSANDILVFLIAPEEEKASLPSKERIKQIFDETRRAVISVRNDVSLSGELIETLPSRGVITNEVIDQETGAVILELSNGTRFILQETANRNNEITMYAIAKGGTVNADDGAIVSVNLLSEMIQVSGLGQFSRTDLVNKLAGKQVSVSFWLSNYYRGFQGSSTTEDLEILFQMLHLFFTKPRLDERAITAMLDQYKTQLAHQLEDPQRFFSNELSKLLSGNNPHLKPLELDDMDKVSIPHAEMFLNACLNTAGYTFVFTGNINLEAIREYAAVYIASIDEGVSITNWRDPQLERPQNVKNNIYKGKDDRSIVYLSWIIGGEDTFNEGKNQVSALLSEYLDILLIDEIREKLGGVYGISAGASVSVIPTGEQSLSVYFVCNPLRVDELITAVINSVENIFNQPLNIDIFNKAKEALIMQHERSMQRNLYIAQSYANSAALYDTPLARLNRRPDAIRAVTAEDVQSLCREILSSGLVQLILYPEDGSY